MHTSATQAMELHTHLAMNGPGVTIKKLANMNAVTTEGNVHGHINNVR